MPTGKVKWFSPEKGFGFIFLDDETEVFVHYSEITGDGFRLLHADEEVEFELADTAQGYQARNVVRVLNGVPPIVQDMEEPDDLVLEA